MFGRLLLILVQLVIGWYAALEIAKTIPRVGNLEIFVMAAIFALLVWAVGVLAGAILKDVSQPGPPALLFAFAVAVIFATLAIYPDVQSAVSSVVGNIDPRVYPLVGAVIGYAVQS